MAGRVVVILLMSTHALFARYPETRKSDVRDTYHGVEVADPYRWLEDDHSAETKAWVEAQNAVTFAFLEKIPERLTFRERLTKLWNYERFSTPWKEGGRYFWGYNSGLQNQRVLYVAESLDKAPRVLLDPNALSADGTVALTGARISDDGELLAYGLARAGSDWQEWRVREVATGRDRTDLVQWVKFSGAAWAKDGSGFYYSRFDAPRREDQLKGVNEYHKLYFHKLGTSQDADVLVYERRDQKEWGFHGGVTDDGRYLIIGVTRGTDPKNAVFYRDLQNPTAGIVELLPDFDADYSFIDNIGSTLLFQHRSGSASQPGHRHRCRPAATRQLARSDPTGGGVAQIGQLCGRSSYLHLSEGRAQRGENLRSG